MSGPRFPFGIVEYDTDTWAMLYTEDGDFTLNYATAPKSDPHTWTKSPDNPIMTGEVANTIRGGAVIKLEGTYHILYDTIGQFCYASGTALDDLTKHSATDEPVFEGTGVAGWERFARHPYLFFEDGTYHMFYDGRNGSPQGSQGDIGHATSEDMINWTRDPLNPVLVRGVASWEADDVGAPTVCFFEGQYWLAYAGYDGSGAPFPHWLGYATSDVIDGGTWIKSAVNPVVSPGPTGTWSRDLVSGPVFFLENGNMHLYYEGKIGSVYSIGYATRDAT